MEIYDNDYIEKLQARKRALQAEQISLEGAIKNLIEARDRAANGVVAASNAFVQTVKALPKSNTGSTRRASTPRKSKSGLEAVDIRFVANKVQCKNDILARVFDFLETRPEGETARKTLTGIGLVYREGLWTTIRKWADTTHPGKLIRVGNTTNTVYKVEKDVDVIGDPSIEQVPLTPEQE